ncbi:MAG: hypothetical protein IPH13_06035 [Planctomycetes bacterium]|nr:hypothetical protein [Planctomycetota bacterium]
MLSVPSANGQCENKQLAKLLSPGPAVFGSAVDLDGDLLVIGAADTSSGGRAYFYERVSGLWLLAHTVSGPYAQVGESVAIANGRVFVARRGVAVDVYEKTGGQWMLAANIPNPIPNVPFTAFGSAMSADGDTLAIGDLNQTRTYVVSKSGAGWTSPTLILPTDSSAFSNFGQSVSLEGNTLVVGAYTAVGGQNSSGAAYVFAFDGNTWIQRAKLTDPSSTVSVGVGHSVSVRSGLAAIGSHSGRVLVYEDLGLFWALQAIIDRPSNFAQEFGRSVAIAPDRLVIGAYGDTSYAAGAVGSSYVYAKPGGSWKPALLLTPDTALGFGTGFGYAIALSGSEVAIGARTEGAGATYVMRSTPNPDQSFGAACPGSGGFSPTLAILSSFDGCKHPGESVSIQLQSALGNTGCLLVLGTQSSSIPLPSGCTLLTVSAATPIALPVFGSGPGNGSITVGASIPVNFPLVSVFMQAFVFDPGVAQGYCATNGLRLSVY